MTNGFALKYEKSLQIYFWVLLKCQAKKKTLKHVENTVVRDFDVHTGYKGRYSIYPKHSDMINIKKKKNWTEKKLRDLNLLFLFTNEAKGSNKFYKGRQFKCANFCHDLIQYLL